MNNTFGHYTQRIALWHEAGHAVAAHVFGLKIISLGLNPLPHCLVNQFGADKEQLGILLCAGAAASYAAFGFEWGQDNDYKIASQLGDLQVFRSKAHAFVKEHYDAIQHVVDELAGDYNPDVAERRVSQIRPQDPRYDALTELVEKSRPSKLLQSALGVAAGLQVKYPKAAARLASVGARLRFS